MRSEAKQVVLLLNQKAITLKRKKDLGGMQLLENRFESVWKSFCEYYQGTRRDYEYYNTPEMYSRSGFHGPHFREENDIVFHLARLCQSEFGDGWVHLNSPIYRRYFDKLDTKKRFVDIDISDPDSFMIINSRRGVFVEVKWIWQGVYKARRSWLRDLLEGIERDAEKLKLLFDNGCCEHAFVSVVDEEPENSQIEKQNKVDEWEKKHSPVRILVHSYHGKP